MTENILESFRNDPSFGSQICPTDPCHVTIAYFNSRQCGRDIQVELQSAMRSPKMVRLSFLLHSATVRWAKTLEDPAIQRGYIDHLIRILRSGEIPTEGDVEDEGGVSPSPKEKQENDREGEERREREGGKEREKQKEEKEESGGGSQSVLRYIARLLYAPQTEWYSSILSLSLPTPSSSPFSSPSPSPSSPSDSLCQDELAEGETSSICDTPDPIVPLHTLQSSYSPTEILDLATQCSPPPHLVTLYLIADMSKCDSCQRLISRSEIQNRVSDLLRTVTPSRRISLIQKSNLHQSRWISDEMIIDAIDTKFKSIQAGVDADVAWIGEFLQSFLIAKGRKSAQAFLISSLLKIGERDQRALSYARLIAFDCETLCDYPQLSLPTLTFPADEQIVMVDSLNRIREVRDFLSLSAPLTYEESRLLPSILVGVDMEWKPNRERGGFTDVAIVQLGCLGKTFLLDLFISAKDLYMWQEMIDLIDRVFTSPHLIKVNYA